MGILIEIKIGFVISVQHACCTRYWNKNLKMVYKGKCWQIRIFRVI